MRDDKPGSQAKGGNKDSTTTVGPTITIRGKLKSGEDLIVKGRIDAEITSSKALFIENSGIVKANMNVASARISGVLLGDVAAESKVEIASDGRMIGDILAPRIVIQDGAAFRGEIDMPNFDAEPGARARSPKPPADTREPRPEEADEAAVWRPGPGAGEPAAWTPPEPVDAPAARQPPAAANEAATAGGGSSEEADETTAGPAEPLAGALYDDPEATRPGSPRRDKNAKKQPS